MNTWLLHGVPLQWTVNPSEWREASVLTLTEYQRQHFPRLQELAEGITYRRDFPWRSLTEHVLTSISQGLPYSDVNQVSIYNALSASSLDTVQGLQEYLKVWSTTSSLVRDAQSMTHWNAKTFATLSTMGAWLGDCVHTELLVRAGRLAPHRQYSPTANAAYGTLGHYLRVVTGNYSSRNNVGNVLEHLMWIALEEDRCHFIVAVQHWIIHQWSANSPIQNIESSAPTLENDAIDTTAYREVQYTLLEHSGDKIVLPGRCHISTARYASVDDALEWDVTTQVRNIANRNGKVFASNTLFGDPAKKKRKKLTINVLLPPETLLELEQRTVPLQSYTPVRRVVQEFASSAHDGPQNLIATADPEIEFQTRSLPDADVATCVLEEHSWKTLHLPISARIISAFYGDAAQLHGRDVTYLVRDLRANTKPIYASNSLFGDPLPRVRKFLFIKYKLHP